MNSGYYILGEEVELFEKEYATFVDSKYSIGVANGLEAISLALIACGIEPGDEVIVPSNTHCYMVGSNKYWSYSYSS